MKKKQKQNNRKTAAKKKNYLRVASGFFLNFIELPLVVYTAQARTE